MIVTVLPLQIVPLLIEPNATVGVALTVTVVVKLLEFVLVQPAVLVPFTVYTVVEFGVTVKIEPVVLPGNKV